MKDRYDTVREYVEKHDLGAKDLTPRAVRIFKNSPAYELELVHESTLVLRVENAGRGGCNRYDMYDVAERFEKDCRADFGDTEALDGLCACFADGATTYAEAVLNEQNLCRLRGWTG